MAALTVPVLADIRGTAAVASQSLLRQDVLTSGSIVRAKKKSTSPSKPKEIPKKELSGNPRKDALTIALSQVGYREKRRNGRQYSYYGGWASDSQAATGAPWCSEFVAWCIQKAGVPEELYPRFTSVYAARNFFGPLGRVFAVEGGNKHSADWIKKKNYAGAISLTDIQRGDVVLVRRNTTRKSSPSHTAMVRDVDAAAGIIYTVDGNVGKAPTKVMKRKLTVKHVYAVIKPFYELYPLKNLTAESVEEKDEEKTWFFHNPDEDEEESEEDSNEPIIHVTWKDRKGVTGYRVLRADSPDGEYEQVKEIFDSAITSYYDKNVIDGETYYYKVVPFVETASGEVVDGSSYLEEAEKDDQTTWVEVTAVSKEPVTETVSETAESEHKAELITEAETETELEPVEPEKPEKESETPETLKETESEETKTLQETEVDQTDTQETATGKKIEKSIEIEESETEQPVMKIIRETR